MGDSNDPVTGHGVSTQRPLVAAQKTSYCHLHGRADWCAAQNAGEPLDLDALARSVVDELVRRDMLHDDFDLDPADLIRSVLARAVSQEREACAVAMETKLREWEDDLIEKDRLHGGVMETIGRKSSLILVRKAGEIGEVRTIAAAAIRARGAKPGEGA